jgi:hypothetical protein
MWFNGDSVDFKSFTDKWMAVVNTLPECFDLPIDSRLDMCVVDNKGEVITLCVRFARILPVLSDCQLVDPLPRAGRHFCQCCMPNTKTFEGYL